MPVIATAGQPDTLADLMQRWQELNAITFSDGKAIDALENDLTATAPPLPAILKQLVRVPEGKPLSPDNENGWSLVTLERFIATIAYDVAVRHDVESGFVLGVSTLPLPREALETFKTIRQARLVHDAAIEAHFADHAARQADWEAMLSEQDDVLQEIVDRRPVDWPDLHHKADWLRSSGALKRITDCADDVGLTGALVADILALAGKGIKAA